MTLPPSRVRQHEPPAESDATVRGYRGCLAVARQPVPKASLNLALLYGGARPPKRPRVLLNVPAALAP
jgi:hypothetical protein